MYLISKKETILFIAALLFMNVRIDLIGSISLTELFVLTQIPHLLRWLNVQGKRIPNYHKCTKRCICYFYGFFFDAFLFRETGKKYIINNMDTYM